MSSMCYWDAEEFTPLTYVCKHCGGEVLKDIGFMVIKCDCGKMNLVSSIDMTREIECKEGEDYDIIRRGNERATD